MGVFCWSPPKEYYQRKKLTLEDNIKFLTDTKPNQLCDLQPIKDKLPLYFENLSPMKFPGEFSYEIHKALPLFLMTQQGLKIDDINFLLGGSSLYMLAFRNKDKKTYLVQRYKNVIFICKHKDYT